MQSRLPIGQIAAVGSRIFGLMQRIRNSANERRWRMFGFFGDLIGRAPFVTGARVFNVVLASHRQVLFRQCPENSCTCLHALQQTDIVEKQRPRRFS